MSGIQSLLRKKFLRWLCLFVLVGASFLAIAEAFRPTVAMAQANLPVPADNPVVAPILSQEGTIDLLMVQAAPSTSPVMSAPPAAGASDPGSLRPLNQENSVLSIAGGQRLMNEALKAVSAQDYPLAVKRFQEARQIFNQLSNLNQDIVASFSGIDNRIADTHRRRALETAQMRDQATYQLALVHRVQNQPELAVPLLIQIVRSQNPTRELGQKSYQQLFELGFVETPFPREGGSTP